MMKRSRRHGELQLSYPNNQDRHQISSIENNLQEIFQKITIWKYGFIMIYIKLILKFSKKINLINPIHPQVDWNFPTSAPQRFGSGPTGSPAAPAQLMGCHGMPLQIHPTGCHIFWGCMWSGFLVLELFEVILL